jgi:uncharacterized protein (DUF362 family)
MVTRREFVATSAAALAACNRAPRPAARASAVSIVRVAGYDRELVDPLRRIFAEHRLDVRGKRVLLKPNLEEADAKGAVNTHAQLAAATIEALRAHGAAEVRLGEGPASRPDAFEVAEEAGYFQAVPGFEQIFTDLNYDETVAIPLHHASGRTKTLHVARSAFAYDVVISLAKMKTHHWAGVTLSMKNLFGFVPGSIYGWPKNQLHWSGIDACIADLHAAIPVHFNIVDGIVGMDGNGPIQGEPKPAGVLVAGRSPVAVDATCCRVMQIDPAVLTSLRLPGEALDASVIVQRGERIADVQQAFALPPTFPSIRLKQQV